MSVAVAVGKSDVGGFQNQFASSRHSVSRVCRQVHQHLLDLPQVGLDQTQVVGQAGVDFHVFSDQPPQHALHVGNHLVEVEHSRLQNLLAAESQQLADQSACTSCCYIDLPQIVLGLLVLLRLAHGKLTVAANHRQQVVEVMGDAPGKR